MEQQIIIQSDKAEIGLQETHFGAQAPPTLFALPLDAPPDPALENRLDEPTRRRLAQMSRASTREQTLAVHLLLRLLLCRRLGAANSALHVETSAQGKPFLSGALGQDCHFSLSHTPGAVAVALDARPIGADIERLRPQNFRLARRFFSLSEQAYVFAEESGVDRRLLAVWTRKEALFKQSGQGRAFAIAALDSLSVDPAARLSTFEAAGCILSACTESAAPVRLVLLPKDILREAENLAICSENP